MNFFSSNLKQLTDKYSQKYVAAKTGFSQSSINNYISKTSEPSIQFLIALKQAFGISVDDFLFKEYQEEVVDNKNVYVGNYLIYYYNNASYKGEIHSNIKNTLSYGVVSIVPESETSSNVVVYALMLKERSDAVKLLKKVNTLSNADLLIMYKDNINSYVGEIHTNPYNIFISLENKNKDDEAFLILNNPQLKNEYLGGLGTINSVSRGREHNPCVQYVILSRKLIDKPDGELYNILSLDCVDIDFDTQVNDLVPLFKRLYMENNELSNVLNDEQKASIIENKLKYLFNEIIDANMFRIGKISNHDDDTVYRLLKEGIDV
ncbi:MAG: helix-turn-helix transcriptional regulator [Clostridiales bacterium]|nr:helix-turn-helix transcriptional regulator [Clostridiales bacterium]